jgi:hypothetical protein
MLVAFYNRKYHTENVPVSRAITLRLGHKKAMIYEIAE